MRQSRQSKTQISVPETHDTAPGVQTMVDLRPEAVAQKKLRESVESSNRSSVSLPGVAQQVVQRATIGGQSVSIPRDVNMNIFPGDRKTGPVYDRWMSMLEDAERLAEIKTHLKTSATYADMGAFLDFIESRFTSDPREASVLSLPSAAAAAAVAEAGAGSGSIKSKLSKEYPYGSKEDTPHIHHYGSDYHLQIHDPERGATMRYNIVQGGKRHVQAADALRVSAGNADLKALVDAILEGL